jgi:hypothetical protein
VGYFSFSVSSPGLEPGWNSRINELFAINTSADFRQGKMNESYFEFPEPMALEFCPSHFHKTYGAFTSKGERVGYIDVRFCGEWE